MSNNTYVSDSDRGSSSSGFSEASPFSVPIPISWGDADFVRYMLDQNRDHPVMEFVKRLPFESSLYPAMRYLRKSVPCSSAIQFREGVQEGVSEAVQEVPQEVSQEGPVPWMPYISWCMPGHDRDRPVRKGCGFVVTKHGSLVYSMCPSSEEHHLKAKRRHCWSLRCPSCMNDTALKRGVLVERQLLMYKELSLKRGEHVGDIGHWVASPPQEEAKALVQTKDGFDALSKRVDDCMMAYGATAGVTVFHPWRQREDFWEFSPHYHVLCYGRIDTYGFRKANPGWIIKKVHPRERIRSIRHTAAYLLTHMGLGLAERDPDDVDWDLRVLDLMIPGILSPGADFTDDDWSVRPLGKGRMSGDLSGFDWVSWTMRLLCSGFRLRYWGGASRRAIRSVAVHRQYKIRVCAECGALLRVYDGSVGSEGALVRYIRDSPVCCFADDYGLVMAELKRYKSSLGPGAPLDAFARGSERAVCVLDLPLPPDSDLVMDGPFAEPDSKFIRRQAAAYGPGAVSGGALRCVQPSPIIDIARRLHVSVRRALARRDRPSVQGP